MHDFSHFTTLNAYYMYMYKVTDSECIPYSWIFSWGLTFMFWSIFDFHVSKFRFLIDVAQTPPMTINMKIRPHENIPLYGTTCTCTVHVHVQYMYMYCTCTCTVHVHVQSYWLLMQTTCTFTCTKLLLQNEFIIPLIVNTLKSKISANICFNI